MSASPTVTGLIYETVEFNISTTITETIDQFNFTVIAPTSSGQALVSVIDIQLIEAGVNFPCFGHVNYTLSADKISSDSKIVQMSLSTDVFTNTG